MRLGCIFGMVAILALGLANAQGDTWNAYTGFHNSDNVDTAIWQYGYNGGVGNNGLFPTYAFSNTAGHDAWMNTGGQNAWRFLGQDPSDLTQLHTHPDALSPWIGWKNTTGSALTVDVGFTVNDLSTDGGGDGVQYSLFKNDLFGTPLAQLQMNDGGTATVSQNGISVAAGDILMLQIAQGENSRGDLTGINMTVTGVPEPGTLVLLATGLIGLLAYAWRKRR